MGRQKKRKLFVYVAIILLFLSFAGLVLQMSGKFLRQKIVYEKEYEKGYHDALDKVKGYYSALEGEVDIGSVFMVKLLAAKEPRFASSFLALSKKEEFSSNPFIRVFNASYGLQMNISRAGSWPSGNESSRYDNRFYSLGPRYAHYLEDPTDDILIKALYCDEVGYDDYDFWIVEDLAGLGGYEETHALIALGFIEENRCYDQGKIVELKKIIARSLVDSQEKEIGFNDLYVERIVVLYWGGFGSLVREDWMWRVRESQNVDGGWGDGVNVSNPHTTGLAMLSLEYFIEGDPKQDLFVD